MAQLAIIKQMSGQVSCGSAGDYQADEGAGVAGLSWRLSSRCAGRWLWAQLPIIKQMSGKCRGAQLAIIKQMSGRCPVAQVTIINQMSGHVSRGSAGDYQADEQARVALLNWRLSSR